jgi:hypothetical protein
MSGDRGSRACHAAKPRYHGGYLISALARNRSVGIGQRRRHLQYCKSQSYRSCIANDMHLAYSITAGGVLELYKLV